MAGEQPTQEEKINVDPLLQCLLQQHASWEKLHRHATAWSFYIAHGNGMEEGSAQLLRCTLCHPQEVQYIATSRKTRKGFIQYSSGNGTAPLKIHAKKEHRVLFDTLDSILLQKKAILSAKETSIVTTVPSSTTLMGKRKRSSESKRSHSLKMIRDFSDCGSNLRSEGTSLRKFGEDLILLVTKSAKTFSIVDDPYFRKMVQNINPNLRIPTRKELIDVHLPLLYAKILETNVLPILHNSDMGSLSCDLWMKLDDVSEVYTLDWYCVTRDWEFKNITLGIINFNREAPKSAHITQIHSILDKYHLRNRCIGYTTSNETTSLSLTIIEALDMKEKNNVLGIPAPFHGRSWPHSLLRICNDATNIDSIGQGFEEFDLNSVIEVLGNAIKSSCPLLAATKQKTTRLSRKENSPQYVKESAWCDSFVQLYILFYYAKQQYKKLVEQHLHQAGQQENIPLRQMLLIAEGITSVLEPFMKEFIVQSSNKWLLSDAIYVIMNLCIQFRSKQEVLLEFSEGTSFDQELQLLKLRICQSVVQSLESVLGFAREYDRNYANNILVLMLDPRFRGLNILQELIGIQAAKAIIVEYDQKSLLPMLLHSFKRMHCHERQFDEEKQPSLNYVSDGNLFGTDFSSEETALEIVKNELLSFRRIRLKNDGTMSPLIWWKNNQSQFPTLAFVYRQIIGIAASEVATKQVYSIGRLIDRIKRNIIGREHLQQISFILKNSPEEVQETESNIEAFLKTEELLCIENAGLLYHWRSPEAS